MRKVFFEKRCIIICSPDDPALSDPNAVVFRLGESIDIHTLIGMIESSDSLQRTCIPTDDIEDTYRRICAEFIEVNAGGGLVSNRRGDFLLISRNFIRRNRPFQHTALSVMPGILPCELCRSINRGSCNKSSCS